MVLNVCELVEVSVNKVIKKVKCVSFPEFFDGDTISKEDNV